MARLIKPDKARGEVFDELVKCFGTSVLGTYEGNLRIELLDPDTDEPVQFSIKVTKGKTLLDEIECDEYIPIDDLIDAYNDAYAQKQLEIEAKKAKRKKKD